MRSEALRDLGSGRVPSELILTTFDTGAPRPLQIEVKDLNILTN